jgi:hypothetical protein
LSAGLGYCRAGNNRETLEFMEMNEALAKRRVQFIGLSIDHVYGSGDLPNRGIQRDRPD